MIKAFYILIILLFSISIVSCNTPIIQEEKKQVEEKVKEEIIVEETKSDYELKLEEIPDEEAKIDIIQILDDFGITDEKERIAYIEKILELKNKQINIDYIFSLTLEGFSLNEKLMLIEAFNEFELSNEEINKYVGIINNEISAIRFESEQDRIDFIYDTLITEASSKTISEEVFPIRIKTLVLNYDPVLESQGNKYLHEVCSFNNPEELAQGYIDDLNNCSGGKVIYEIVDWIDIDDIIPYMDGFKYTGETFYENFKKASSERWDWWGWSGWHAQENNQASGMANYLWILESNNLIERLNSGEIDEVLIFAQPFSGMYESLMIGPDPIYCNSPPLIVPELNKNFIIMSFNYERGVDCMLENFGHRVESILSYVFNKDSSGINYWERFTLYDKIAPGEAGCGNVHYAPNSESDYDWGNKRNVYSTCDDWLNYPNLTGEKREVNYSDWGNGDMRLHHLWWLSHIPKSEGLDLNGMLNNWWGYFTKFFKGN